MDKEYRNANGISKSELWNIRRTPAYFEYVAKCPQEATPAMLFGQMVHKLILEPADFGNEFAVVPSVDKRTKEGKAEYEKFLSEKGDREEVSAKDFDLASNMALALYGNGLAHSLISRAEVKEQAFFWKDARTELECKCKVDGICIADNQLIIFDYKTTSDVDPSVFVRTCLKYGYDVQAAHYIRGVKANLTEEEKEKYTIKFVLIAQEKTEPYLSCVCELSDEIIEYGLQRLDGLLDKLKECIETNNWYNWQGKEDMIVRLELPNWVSYEESEE